MSNYANIPGITVEVLDNQLSTSVQATNGRMLLIGEVPASVVAVDEPTLVRTANEVRNAIGDFIVDGKANPLAVEWQAAMNESNLSIYVLPLKGTTVKEKFINLHAQLTDYMIDMQFDHVVLTGLTLADDSGVLEAKDFPSEDVQSEFPLTFGVVTKVTGTGESATTTYVGSPAKLIADYAKRQSLETNQSLAYIGVPAPADTSVKAISTHVKAIMALDTSISPYLQLYAGPHVGVSTEGSLRTQWSTGVAVYAAQVSRLAITVAPTNQVLKSVSQLKWVFSPRQLDQLIGHKYVVSTIKNGNALIVDAVTSAPDITVGADTKKSDFTRLSTLRAVNKVVQRLRDAGEPFIGLTADFPSYTALKTAIKAQLDDAIALGEIQDATFQLDIPGEFDTVVIKLTVIPTFELRKINVTLGLSDPVILDGDVTP